MNTPADLFRRRRSKVDALQAKFAAATAELERMDGTDMSERMQEVNLLLLPSPGHKHARLLVHDTAAF